MIPADLAGTGKDYWYVITYIDEENGRMELNIDGEYDEPSNS